MKPVTHENKARCKYIIMGFIDSSLERLEKKIVEENRKLLAETVRHEVRYGVSK
jgi:hypothetical protein